jgi:hypothetical protein
MMASIIIDPLKEVPPLGRNTEATVEAWSKIRRAMPVAPRWKAFRTPAEQVDLTRFDPGYDGTEGAESLDDYFQDRGFCVGWALAGLFWFTSCLPKKLTPRAQRIRAARTSPLYAYMLARWGAKKAGLNLGGNSARDDGAIVSYAVLEAGAGGMLSWAEMPCTTAIEKAHPNNRYPTAEEQAKGKARVPASVAVLESRAQVDEYLDGGHVIDVGTSWTRGLAQPNADGVISALGGGTLGGHSYLIFPAGARLGIKNSHPMYGMRSKDKRYQASDGWTNIAYVDRKKYLDTFFTSLLMSRGDSEAAVIAGPEGFIPRVEF